jgi:hypothetical protein
MRRRWVEAGRPRGGPPRVHIGLGGVNEIDRIEITWPDGHETRTGAVETRQTVRIERLSVGAPGR